MNYESGKFFEPHAHNKRGDALRFALRSTLVCTQNSTQFDNNNGPTVPQYSSLEPNRISHIRILYRSHKAHTFTSLITSIDPCSGSQALWDAKQKVARFLQDLSILLELIATCLWIGNGAPFPEHVFTR